MCWAPSAVVWTGGIRLKRTPPSTTPTTAGMLARQKPCKFLAIIMEKKEVVPDEMRPKCQKHRGRQGKIFCVFKAAGSFTRRPNAAEPVRQAVSAIESSV